MPYEVYLESDKRPQVSVEADRVEKKDGFYTFYRENETIAAFKEEKVVGYIKMVMPTGL